ncbi:ATP-binding protein [Mesorhizobium sp. ORM8.1]
MLLERQAQLRQLEALLADAARGHGHVAALLGEAGAGKTALVETFAGPASRSAVVFRSACEDLSIPDPLGPLYDLAREAQWNCRAPSMPGRPRGCRCFPTRSTFSRQKGRAC